MVQNRPSKLPNCVIRLRILFSSRELKYNNPHTNTTPKPISFTQKTTRNCCLLVLDT